MGIAKWTIPCALADLSSLTAGIVPELHDHRVTDNLNAFFRRPNRHALGCRNQGTSSCPRGRLKSFEAEYSQESANAVHIPFVLIKK